ncbi:uncharacterized protein LOC127788091 [Diospyros lotus]|uniref:uncharacterized protein LOC127788091 n=1 Tax=Diospyros lotus TaxID=55363 RepID=UPI002255ED3A|nr:uncharacterized protein LOC127788091 [Diospyros lotus]
MDDDGDNETDDNGDDSSGDDSGDDNEGGASSEYLEVRFSDSQFDDNPLHGNWVVPGVENYVIEATQPEVLIPYQGDMFSQGALFKSKQKLILAFGQYCVHVKIDYRIRRSCIIRFEVGCKDMNCKFLLRAIVIGSLFSKRVAISEYTPGMLIGELLEQHSVQIMYTKAWRSLQFAKRLAYGNADEPFQQLPSYFHMLKETNHGSITIIEIDENNHLLYSFFALRASLKGFRSYIRPIVSVDATHLKGKYKGVIFVAICKDGEEMNYPIAFGFGYGESDRSWIWFLTKLREAIGMLEDLIIVSD